MKKLYLVRSLIHATASTFVSAETPAEAYDNAELASTLCHECSDKIDLGDEYAFEVADMAKGSNVVLTSGRSYAETCDDVQTLAKHLSGKRLPASIKAIVDKWSK
jgi:hypothetical protein